MHRLSPTASPRDTSSDDVRTFGQEDGLKRGSCSVCTHPDVEQINAAHVSGAGIRELAKRFDRNKDTIARHVRNHVPAAVQAAAAVGVGDAIIAKLETLTKRVEGVLEKLGQKRDHRGMAPFFRELRELLELQARLLGELRDRDINITNVQLDAQTATRMAEMYLARHQAHALPAARDSQVPCVYQIPPRGHSQD